MNAFLFFFGGKRIAADAQNATSLLDLCMERGISYTDFSYDDRGAVSFACSGRAASVLKRLCEERGIAIEVQSAFGLPYFCYRYRKRAGLLLGTMLSIALMILSKSYVWDVRVTGNTTMTDSEVIAELEACGFGVGSYIPTFRAGELENRVLIASDRISWIAVYLDGTVATVQVVEHAQKPPAEDTSKPANLVAAFDGQIEFLELYRGDCLVKVGQAVKKGDLLVSGIYDSQTQGFRYTRASGKVYARTERHFTVEIPLVYEEKVYGEAQRGEITLHFFGFSTKILKSTGNVEDRCDIIKEEKGLDWLGVSSLPMGITVTSLLPYEMREVTRTQEAALELAYVELEQQLAAFSQDTRILKKSISTTLTESALILECDVTCIMDIATRVEFEITQ